MAGRALAAGALARSVPPSPPGRHVGEQLQAMIQQAIQDHSAVLGEQTRRFMERLEALEGRALRLGELGDGHSEIKEELLKALVKRLSVIEQRLDQLARQQDAARESADALAGTSLRLQQQKADAKDVVELLDGLDQRLACKVETSYVDIRFGKMQQFLQHKAASIEARLSEFDQARVDKRTEQFAAIERNLAVMDNQLQEKANSTEVFTCLEGIRRRLQQQADSARVAPPVHISDRRAAQVADSELDCVPWAPNPDERALSSAQSATPQQKFEKMRATKRTLLNITRHMVEEEQSSVTMGRASPVQGSAESASLMLADRPASHRGRASSTAPEPHRQARLCRSARAASCRQMAACGSGNEAFEALSAKATTQPLRRRAVTSSPPPHSAEDLEIPEAVWARHANFDQSQRVPRTWRSKRS